jgi:hypothetical protein
MSVIFPNALADYHSEDIEAGEDGCVIRWEDQSGNGRHMTWLPGEGPRVILSQGRIALELPAPKIDP